MAAVLETLYRLEWEPGTQEAEVLELSQASWAGGAEPEQGETGSRVEPWRCEAGPAQRVAIDMLLLRASVSLVTQPSVCLLTSL